jgi:hypothetical protein
MLKNVKNDKGKANIVSITFVVFRCKWAPSPNLHTIWLPNFFWLLLGTAGHHHQVLIDREFRLPFFLFVCFVAFGVGGRHHEVLA